MALVMYGVFSMDYLDLKGIVMQLSFVIDCGLSLIVCKKKLADNGSLWMFFRQIPYTHFIYVDYYRALYPWQS